MATLDSLPGDQRAVVQLVLGRRRSYDEIAGLLRMDRAAVRERALAALDALGPQTRVPVADRARICDYLLGQRPDDEVPDVRDLLARSAPERAWARVLSAELAPIAADPLPELPSDAAPPTPGPSAPAVEVPDAPPAPAAPADASQPDAPSPRGGGVPPHLTTGPPPAQPDADDSATPPSSRRGGFVLITLVAVIVVVVVLVLVLHKGSKTPSRSAAAPAATSTAAATPSGSATTTPSTPASASASGSGTAPAATATTPATTTPATGTTGTGAATGTTSAAAGSTAGGAHVVAQINLTPTQPGSKAEGIADVVRNGTQRELAIVAQGLAPNTANNAYELWLYNSASDAKSVGFGPVVGKSGKLAAAGTLPANAAHFKQLIVTVETTKAPKTPGTIVMQGPVSGVS
jgi:hypothetical protein